MASPPAITYRTDDYTRWGAGAGANLSAKQVDGNFWSLAQAINDLITNPAQSNNIVAVQATGTGLTFLLANGQSMGPVQIPVARFNWRGIWAPNTLYAELDVFSVSGIGPGTDGLYAATEVFTSAAAFDPTATDAGGNPLTLQMFAYPTQPFSVSLSVGGAFAAMVADSWDGNYELCNVMMPVPVTFPADLATSPAPACEIPPGSAVVLTLQQIHAGGAITLGSINFAAGATGGTFSFVSQVTIPAGDSLRLYASNSVDATMAGLAATIVGSR